MSVAAISKEMKMLRNMCLISAELHEERHDGINRALLGGLTDCYDETVDSLGWDPLRERTRAVVNAAIDSGKVTAGEIVEAEVERVPS